MNKNTKTQLRAKIKEMIIAELEKDVDISDETPENEEDFLAEFIREAKKTKKDNTEEEPELDLTDIGVPPADTTEPIPTTGTTELDPKVKAVQEALENLQKVAETLGDDKLLHQISNTITFFTRTHISEKPEPMAEGLPKGYFKKQFGIGGKKKKLKEGAAWDKCIAKMKTQGKSEKAAEKICGAINAAYVGHYRK